MSDPTLDMLTGAVVIGTVERNEWLRGLLLELEDGRTVLVEAGTYNDLNSYSDRLSVTVQQGEEDE